MKVCGDLCLCENRAGFLVICLLWATFPDYSDVKTNIACSWLLTHVSARWSTLREFSEGCMSFLCRARCISRCGYWCPAWCRTAFSGVNLGTARVSVVEGLLSTCKVCCFSFFQEEPFGAQSQRLSYLLCRQLCGRCCRGCVKFTGASACQSVPFCRRNTLNPWMNPRKSRTVVLHSVPRSYALDIKLQKRF